MPVFEIGLPELQSLPVLARGEIDRVSGGARSRKEFRGPPKTLGFSRSANLQHSDGDMTTRGRSRKIRFAQSGQESRTSLPV